MYIAELIALMKQHSSKTWRGERIQEETTRDQVLYGDPTAECTGVVCTCFPSVSVIEEAGKKGCNFIVTHETLFWNHGDHTDWLKHNTAFQKKKALLDQYHICVWRNHDHIHAGIPINGTYKDGIFYGLSALLGWQDYLVEKESPMPQYFSIPPRTVPEMSALLKNAFHLNTIRFLGNPDCIIRSVYIPLHIMGRETDRGLTEKINDEDINCLITMELVDFTTSAYIRDAALVGENRCIFALGHFNVEELGMEFYASYLAKLIEAVPVIFLPSGDPYSYL